MTDKKKKEELILSESDSLKLEVANLRQQNLELQKQLIDVQKALVNSQETNYQLKAEMLKDTNDKLFEALGLSGNLQIERQENGCYKVKTVKEPQLGPNPSTGN